MNKIYHSQSIFFLFLSLLFFWGCTTPLPFNSDANLISITVLPETMSLSMGGSQTITSITASYDITANATISLTDCSYSSDNPTIATVTNGTITGVTEGSTLIHITYTEGTITQTDTIAVEILPTNGFVALPVHNVTQDKSYLTIQAALDDAQSGDTIGVEDGLYHESITFPSGKVIYLESVNGSPYTSIVGISGQSTVTCNGSLEGSRIGGFIITHYSGTSGAGITNNNGTLTVTGCDICANSAPQPGGGIRNFQGILNLISSFISSNSSVTSGGGILNDKGTVTIIGNSVISKNSSDYGGGICNYHGTLTVTGGSTISENLANNGGGLYNDHGTLTVTGGSTVSENATEYSGGGICNDDGTLNITGATVSENSAGTFGGGISNSHGTVTVSLGSMISENTADSLGGGISDILGTLLLTGSTISENSSKIDGGGISMYPEASPTHVIGGSNSADTANFNSFINNKKGDTVSSAQHIRSENSGDIHDDYPNNYYNPS